MARKSLDELERQDFWTLPEFARLKCGRGPEWVRRRFHPDATNTRGVIRLVGLEVPVDKDHNGFWLVSKNRYELAKRRAEGDVREAG